VRSLIHVPVEPDSVPGTVGAVGVGAFVRLGAAILLGLCSSEIVSSNDTVLDRHNEEFVQRTFVALISRAIRALTS
jgi:hypothetical protein